MSEVFDEVLKFLKHTRGWVREAEEMAPREAAQMLDGVRGTLSQAFEHEKAGRHDEAMAVLQNAQTDDEDDS